MMLSKTNDPGYMKDNASGALINIDEAQYQHFLQERKQALEIQRLSKQVADMQSNFAEIKSLLQQLIREK